MAGLRLAACAVLLCVLLSPSSALRWLADPAPETAAAAAGHDSYRTAYHFQPANNWQNGRESPPLSVVLLKPNHGFIHSLG
nr:fructan 6-exohydrolase-like [Lolium perenne]